MNSERAQMIARDLMDHHGLSAWRFEMRPMKSLFGYCYWSKRLITLSKLLTELNEEAEVINTILHEIAHALAPTQAHHNHEWKRIAEGIACTGMRCYDTAVVATPPKQWMGSCPKCSFKVFRHRKRVCSCPKCNPKWDKRFQINWTPC